MTVDIEDEDCPDYSFAKEFYAKYEPKEVLGKGVSSTVRRCVEKETGRSYAVKIIDVTSEGALDYQAEELRIATKKEMNILKLCAGHPHIIELHDTFETPTFIFLVFELCQKGELFDYLTEVVTMSEKRTRLIMRQLLESIAFIHEKNVVHRDLKPENVLLDDDLNVKLSDFGFACVLAEGEELTDLCGTPGYLAPEVLAVSMYDDAPGYTKEVDMWACGVIMYTLLVGCPPFWHRKQMYMLRAIMAGDYKLNTPEWDDISEPPKDLINKFLVVDPTKRITASEALAHPFFKREEKTKTAFYPKRVFRAGIIAVRATFRIRSLHFNPPAVNLESARNDPYKFKNFRKIIDGCAFKIYGHWVKKGEDQNRAALFEMAPKQEWKNMQKPSDDEYDDDDEELNPYAKYLPSRGQLSEGVFERLGQMTRRASQSAVVQITPLDLAALQKRAMFTSRSNDDIHDIHEDEDDEEEEEVYYGFDDEKESGFDALWT